MKPRVRHGFVEVAARVWINAAIVQRVLGEIEVYIVTVEETDPIYVPDHTVDELLDAIALGRHQQFVENAGSSVLTRVSRLERKVGQLQDRAAAARGPE